ncbi:hypothetical protein EAF04_002332 [Stromatinia cepivora]|nr:hypothetical protein EAF04_002332 [Stromatinia cepivora]
MFRVVKSNQLPCPLSDPVSGEQEDGKMISLCTGQPEEENYVRKWDDFSAIVEYNCRGTVQKSLVYKHDVDLHEPQRLINFCPHEKIHPPDYNSCSTSCIVVVAMFAIIFLQTMIQNEAGTVSIFGDTFNVLGTVDSIKSYFSTEMERTGQVFQDGLILDLFSPTNQTPVVQQNMAPLAAQFVPYSSGEPFIALSNYS